MAIPVSSFSKMKMASLLVCFLTVIFAGSPVYGKSLTPREILDKVDDLFRGKSSRGRMSMKVNTAHWSRKLSIEFWSKGKDQSLMRILSPKKEKGTATLRSGNKIWNFLPKINRVIKIPSSMMSASWMGSHFTNDDLVKESRFSDDYTFEVSFEGEREGERIVEITCIPKADAAVVWGKVLVTAREEDFMPLLIRYYDEDLNLMRTMTFSDFKNMGGRNLPAKLVMIPTGKPDESTIVIYDDILFDVRLKDDLFSLHNLQR